MYEAQKKELTFAINVFKKPLEKSGKAAWTEQILNLITMNRGSYPSMPDMGVGMDFVSYQELEYNKTHLKEKIEGQVKTYLPDIPFRSINIEESETTNKDKILVLIIEYQIDANNIETVVVASNVVNNFVNFEVSI